MLSSVDFPEPFGPTMPRTEPVRSRTLTPVKARTAP